MERKQNISGFFLAVLVVGGIISGCSLYKKNGPASPDFSKPTATFTPTLTGIYTDTYTFTPTITTTPTITNTPTITTTPTITNTHVNSTDTVTNTPTMTATVTATATATSTATGCTGGYYSNNYTFDASTMCWQFELTPTGVSPTSGWDGIAGYNAAGSVSLNIPFTAAGQQAVFATSFQSTPENLAGKRITVRLKVDSWLNSAGTGTANINTYPGGVKVIVKTGSGWVYGSNAWQNITTTGSWMTLTLDPGTPSTSNGGYDATQVIQIGVELNTNGSIDAAGFGTAIFHIDDVTVTDITPPTSTPTPGGALGWHFTSSSEVGISAWTIDLNGGSSAAVTAGSLSAWDDTVDVNNSVLSGSASLYVPFSGTSQQILFADSFQTPTLDLSGKTVSVKIRVDSWAGADLANSPAIAQIVLKSSGWIYAGSAWVDLTATGSWITLTMPNASSPSSSNTGYDATQIIQAAVIIQTGSSGTYGPAVFRVDDWLYQ